MSSEQGLDCQHLVELVTNYLEGALPPDEHAQFHAHLCACTGCANYVEQIRRTIQTLGQIREADLPPTDRGELLRLFQDWKQTKE